MNTPQNLTGQMAEKSDQQLLDMLKKASDWSSGALEAARAELVKRGVSLDGVPTHSIPTGLSYHGKYRKVRIKPFKGYGHYRGEGSIEFTDDGLRICGRHVLSLGARWGIGLAIFFGFAIVTAGMFAPGFIIIYLIMEYVWLRREDIVVPYSNVIHYVSDPKKCLVGVDYHGPKWCSPVVLKSDKWSEITAKLREIIPDRDASLMVVPPLRKGRAICLSSLVFIGLYLLFLFIVIVVVVLVMTSQGLNSIPEIKNDAVRNLTWLLMFTIPLVPSFILARRSYRKKRIATRIDGSELPTMSEGMPK